MEVLIEETFLYKANKEERDFLRRGLACSMDAIQDKLLDQHLTKESRAALAASYARLKAIYEKM